MSGLHDLLLILDFDGVVTQTDTTRLLLDRHAPGDVGPTDTAFAHGELTSREWLVDQWEQVRGVPAATQLATVRDVPLDPGFEALLAYVRSGGADVVIVSDGFGFRAREIGARYDVDVLANDVDWTTGALLFPNEHLCCSCQSCGTCMKAPMKDPRAQGRWTVMVGARVADHKAAVRADVLFAKGSLASWCAASDVAFRPYVTLADVHAGIEDIV